jgi:hypothetical protein
MLTFANDCFHVMNVPLVVRAQAYKPRRHTDAVKSLFDFYAIDWHFRAPSEAGGTEISAAVKAEMMELTSRHPPESGRFRVSVASIRAQFLTITPLGCLFAHAKRMRGGIYQSFISHL